MSDFINQNSIEIKFQINDPWAILSPIEQSIKNKIEKYGTPLGKWPGIKINYGIKTGFNEAFIINDKKRIEILNSCKTLIEKEETDKLIRPILRGRDIKRNYNNWSGLYVILAYFDSHKLLKIQCPSIYNHLEKFKTQLENRGQCKYLSSGKVRNENDINYPGYPGMHHWLELDNCPSKKYLDLFDNRVIAWQRITQRNNFCVTDKKMLVLDSMVFISLNENKIENLCTILNSKLFYYWMRKNVHELGESGFLLSNQFVSIFPAIKSIVNNDLDIYKEYHLTDEEISVIEKTK